MKVRSIDKHEQADVQMEGATETKMRMLIGPDDGATSFHMRHFEITPGGHTPHHSHDYEHEILILSGGGIVKSEQGDRPFTTGDVIFIPINEKHQFIQSGDNPCTLICLVPAPKDHGK